jgi:hypothetical protein
MSANKTIARHSISIPVLQADGRSVLKEVGKNFSISQGAASPTQAPVVNNVQQSGMNANAANVPTVLATAATATKNKYYVDLPSFGLTALISAASAEEAWGIFATQNGIVASERDVFITEFLP